MKDNKMYIIGGWLGSGPFASSDVYYLDLGLKFYFSLFILVKKV